jgi:predicted protein tyrosine phosphatase
MIDAVVLELERPIPDSYWVQPGRLLAGEYPGDRDPAEARAKVRRLLAAGVSFFLDLTEEDEYGLQPYRHLLEAQTDGLSRPIQHRRMPIRDEHAPTPDHMAAILATIDEALAAGHTVYVHCWGGIGRTGTVVACHLIGRGRTARASLAELTRLRKGIPDDDMPSPATRAQRAFVRAWSPPEA